MSGKKEGKERKEKKFSFKAYGTGNMADWLPTFHVTTIIDVTRTNMMNAIMAAAAVRTANCPTHTVKAVSLCRGTQERYHMYKYIQTYYIHNYVHTLTNT